MTTAARAEFRVFGHRIIEVVQPRLWNGRTVLQQIRTMPPETYVLSRCSAQANIKIRDGVLDVKVRRGDTFEGFQIFEPVAKLAFPLSPEQVAAVEGYCGVSFGGPARPLAFDEFVARAAAHRDLTLVSVTKERFGFSLDGAICEYARVGFNGALVESACVESDHYEIIAGVVRALGLDDRPNTNYVEAASQVVGLRRRA